METSYVSHKNYSAAASDFRTWLDSARQAVSALASEPSSKNELELNMAKLSVSIVLVRFLTAQLERSLYSCIQSFFRSFVLLFCMFVWSFIHQNIHHLCFLPCVYFPFAFIHSIIHSLIHSFIRIVSLRTELFILNLPVLFKHSSGTIATAFLSYLHQLWLCQLLFLLY